MFTSNDSVNGNYSVTISEKMLKPNKVDTGVSKKGLDLLDKIWRKVGSAKRTESLLTNITNMTRYALNASISLVFLIDEESQELNLKFSNGPVDKQLRRLHLSKNSGIAGWVAQYGRPLIVNDVNKDPRFDRHVDEVTGYVTKSIICAPLIIHQKAIGVIEVINRLDGAYFDAQDLHTLVGVGATAALAIDNIKLNDSLQDSYKGTVSALVSLADAKESGGGEHSKNVCEYAVMGATHLQLSNEEKQIIEYAAILHDIGKLGITDSILNKTRDLTREELEIIQKHPVIGANLLSKIPFLEEASNLILYHHERYDGKGYPHGLKGDDIPMGARLIAVADAFDHMTTKHPYRAALPKTAAFQELVRCTKTQFCPVAVKAFCSGFLKFHFSDNE